MNTKIQSLLATTILALSLSACASTDTTQKSATVEPAKAETFETSKMSNPETMTEEKVMKEASVEKEEKSEKKKKKKKKKKTKGLTETFPVSIEDAKTATMRSMMFNDFDVKNRTNDYIDASRSHTIGGGGEVIKVYFEAIDENTTEIRVRNKKTLLGWALQENWENEIMAGIRAHLSKMKADGS